jgi:hypothetical protein
LERAQQQFIRQYREQTGPQVERSLYNGPFLDICYRVVNMPTTDTRPRIVIKEQSVSGVGNYLKVRVLQYDSVTQKDIVIYKNVIQFSLSDDKDTILKKLKKTIKRFLPKETVSYTDMTTDINKDIFIDTILD